MWKPDDSLDEFIVRRVQQADSEPPPAVSLRPTGDVEFLKPLTGKEVHAKPAGTAIRAFRSAGSSQPLWFRGFVAVGSAVLVLIAFALVSAILVGINDPATGPYIATNGKADDTPPQPDEVFSFYDLSAISTPAEVDGKVDIAHAIAKRRSARPKVRIVGNKYRHRSRRLAQPEQPKFVPTTLVIFAENGVINTRIEPWLRAGDKKTPTFNN